MLEGGISSCVGGSYQSPGGFFCLQVDGPISGGGDYNRKFTVFFFRLKILQSEI